MLAKWENISKLLNFFSIYLTHAMDHQFGTQPINQMVPNTKSNHGCNWLEDKTFMLDSGESIKYTNNLYYLLKVTIAINLFSTLLLLLYHKSRILQPTNCTFHWVPKGSNYKFNTNYKLQTHSFMSWTTLIS